VRDQGLVIQRNPQAAWRLICFPYAGRGAGVYARWGRELGPDVEVCAIQLPGRENRWRETPHRNAAAAVAEIVRALEGELTLPYAIFGHSMGAILAFETVRALRRHAVRLPEILFMSGRQAPHLPLRGPAIHDLAEEEFLKCLQDQFQGLPMEVLADRELRAAVLPALRADVTLLEHYRYFPEEPFDCPVIALGGRQDSQVGREGLEAWAMVTRKAFYVRLFEGGHFYFSKTPAHVLSVIREGWNLVSSEFSKLSNKILPS
jgi:medium-chain acyl-[acyl-carrier-protein] hydrolase